MAAKKCVTRPRADALRNRERLLDEARSAFAALGPAVALEEVARRAEVGIGTLYRHFPTRAALVESMYRREVEQLAEAADGLLESHTPSAALQAWLKLFVDYLDQKKLIVSALEGRASGHAALFDGSRELIRGALARLVERGIASRELRGDVQSEDLLRALAGFSFGQDTAGWRASTLRLIQVLMDGLRASREAPAGRPSRAPSTKARSSKKR